MYNSVLFYNDGAHYDKNVCWHVDDKNGFDIILFEHKK